MNGIEGRTVRAKLESAGRQSGNIASRGEKADLHGGKVEETVGPAMHEEFQGRGPEQESGMVNLCNLPQRPALVRLARPLISSHSITDSNNGHNLVAGTEAKLLPCWRLA